MCMLCRSLFVPFLLAIVLSVLLRFADSNYPFGIFKLFLQNIKLQKSYHLQIAIPTKLKVVKVMQIR